MVTEFSDKELYGRLYESFGSGSGTKASIKLIGDRLLSIADGNVPDAMAIAHPFGFMTLRLAGIRDKDGMAYGAVLHGWCLPAGLKTSSFHKHSFNMVSQVLLRQVRNRPVDVKLIRSPEEVSSTKDTLFKVYDTVSTPEGTDIVTRTSLLATAHARDPIVIEEGQTYDMKECEWHVSEPDSPEAWQTTEPDFPLTLMLSQHDPAAHNYVLGSLDPMKDSVMEVSIARSDEQVRGLYTPEETASIAARYAVALGLDRYS